MSNTESNKLKADAIMNLVDIAIGAFINGFTDRNKMTLAELHQIARNHISDNYKINIDTMPETWGDDIFAICSKQDNWIPIEDKSKLKEGAHFTVQSLLCDICDMVYFDECFLCPVTNHVTFSIDEIAYYQPLPEAKQ